MSLAGVTFCPGLSGAYCIEKEETVKFASEEVR